MSPYAMTQFGVDLASCPWPALRLYIEWRDTPETYQTELQSNLLSQLVNMGDTPWQPLTLLNFVAFWDYLAQSYGDKTIGLVSQNISKHVVGADIETDELFQAIQEVVIHPVPKIITRWVHYILTFGTSFYKGILMKEGAFANIVLPFYDTHKRWSLPTRPSITDASVSTKHQNNMYLSDIGECERYIFNVDQDARLALAGFEIFDMTPYPINYSRVQWSGADAPNEFKLMLMASYTDGSYEVFGGLMSPVEIPEDRRQKIERLHLVVCRVVPCGQSAPTHPCTIEILVPLCSE